MDPTKLELLADGLLTLTRALDEPFLTLVGDMERAGILDHEQTEAVIEYTGGPFSTDH